MRSHSSNDYYFGRVAYNYDTDRRKGPIRRYKWEAEFKCLKSIFRTLPENSAILDVPCGTGRFLPLMTEKFESYACDISEDMVSQIPKSTLEKLHGLYVARIGALPFDDNKFDYCLCMRFFNLFPTGESYKMLKDLCRVVKKGVIIQIRFYNPLWNLVLRLYKFFSRSTLPERSLNKSFKITQKGQSPPILHFPKKREFELAVNSMGFYVESYIPVISVLDSQRICILKRSLITQF